MSEREIKAALDRKSPKGTYFVYRVFEVRSSTPRILRYDFYKLFSKGLIHLKNVKDFYIELPKSLPEKTLSLIEEPQTPPDK